MLTPDRDLTSVDFPMISQGYCQLQDKPDKSDIMSGRLTMIKLP